MSTLRREQVTGLALTWIACGGTILALAFTVRPVQASRAVFWTVMAMGGAVLLVGCGVMIRGTVSRRWNSRAAARRRRLLAPECYRLYNALSDFLAERERGRPRSARWSPSTNRVDEWQSDTTARYRIELRNWAMEVFDDAVACGAVSSSARALVQSPAASQLATVRDLFRDAAQALERS